MVFTMSDKERLIKENAELTRKVEQLEASVALSKVDTKELDNVLKSCKRIFTTFNKGKRNLVLAKGAIDSLDGFCKPSDKRFHGTYSTAKREIERSAMEYLSLENDFRNLHHFIKFGKGEF